MIRLIILGLLQQKPMHGYEIQQSIQEQQMELWANVLSGSIYFALNKMEQEGLIRAEAEERTGNRLRKKFALTEDGRQQLLELLRQALLSPPHMLKSDFSVALGYAGLLAKEELDHLLLQNLRRIEDTQRVWETALPAKGALHPAIGAILTNDLAVMAQDRDLLKRLLEINARVTGQKAGRPKATHLIVRTSGTYKHNAYMYEETVPIEKYEHSQWWSLFKPREVRDVLKKIPGAREGDVFTIQDSPSKKTVTKIWAVVQTAHTAQTVQAVRTAKK